MSYFAPETDPKLFACPCGKCDVKPTQELLDALNDIRVALGRPMVVTSGPRCPAYNAKVGGAPNSEHLTGQGADIACTESGARWALVSRAMVRVKRLGIGKDFIHIGVGQPTFLMWHYYDKGA